MADYVVLRSAQLPFEEVQFGLSLRFFLTCRAAAEGSTNPLEVRDPLREVLPGDDVEDKINEVIRGASGAIVMYGRDQLLAADLGSMAARSIPLFAAKPPRIEAREILRISPPVSTIVDFDLGATDESRWNVLREQVEHWLSSVPRPNSRGTDILTIEELRGIEAFATAFYRTLESHGTGLSGDNLQTAQIHVETLNLQVRAPEPNRRIIQATVAALGGLLSGVGGNYLYALLPHIH